MQIKQLRVNNIERPMGFNINPVSISWIIDEFGSAKKQQWARIVIKKGSEIVFDSGEDENADSLDYRVHLNLQPRTRYSLHVHVKADNGDYAEEHSFFETGKMDEEWSGQWISTQMKTKTGIIFSKTIDIDKPVKEARIYCCALGVYELYINGQKVGDEYLAPGYHSYDFHIQAQTYDITKYLKDGKNNVEFHAGDGWFKGRLGFDGGFTDIYGDRCYAIGEIYIKHSDDSVTEVFTDKSWKYKESPVVFSNIYDGEIYDARLENKNDWNEVIEKEPEGCGKITDRFSIPVVKKESFKPVEIIKTPKGETVLDFGQNMTGWVEFDCDIPEGKEITLTASEIMQDGCFYHENLRTAKTEFKYISSGKKAHVRPHFTFYGFRYMKVECEENIDLNDFTAYHLRSDFDEIGFIKTGNEKVNQLFRNALWSQKDNFLDVPTDCPQRDERLGWTGDAQVFSATACYNMYMPAFYRKYLWDMRAEQSILGGSVPNVVPRLKKGMVAEHGACPWADAGVIIPWNVYLHYGNKTLLDETYPGMKAWVDCQRKREEAVEGPHLVKDGFHFADWLALDNEQPGPFGATDPLFIASAYYYRCAEIVSKSAEVLGKNEEAEEYKKLSSEILKALQEKYFDEEGKCICRTQTASAITIEFGLMKGMEFKEGNALNERVALKNNHLDTGFVGTPLLCPALTRSGHNDTAVTLLLNETFPSWLYSVNLGATTIWERWNSVLEDGTLNPEGMNSLNHYSYGS
ncbi:MAG: family 78 glycoside hydrolase catalytic domain, partial [Clostridium sp.]|nr:family 78 glycoside hydrolase catalytic domain [Clostridium sp.]